MDFLFGLPKDCEENMGIVVFVDRLSKMAHVLAAMPDFPSIAKVQLCCLSIVCFVNTGCC